MSRAWPVDELDPSASLAQNARRILAVRIAEVYSYEPIVRLPDADTELHDLRIAVKRLRYTLELFRSVFGELGEKQITRAKALQQELGQLHDHDVRITIIDDEIARIDRDLADHESMLAQDDPQLQRHQDAQRLRVDRPGLVAYLAREHQRRSDCHDRLVARWQQFHDEGMRAELVWISAKPTPPPIGADTTSREPSSMERYR